MPSNTSDIRSVEPIGESRLIDTRPSTLQKAIRRSLAVMLVAIGVPTCLRIGFVGIQAEGIELEPTDPTYYLFISPSLRRLTIPGEYGQRRNTYCAGDGFPPYCSVYVHSTALREVLLQRVYSHYEALGARRRVVRGEVYFEYGRYDVSVTVRENELDPHRNVLVTEQVRE